MYNQKIWVSKMLLIMIILERKEYRYEFKNRLEELG